MPRPVKASRAYNSPRRTEQARRTRRRVVEAARDLFLDNGYPRTTIAAIAERAGVAADTVLHLFGSKRGLLKDVMDVVIGGDDEDVALLDRSGPQAVRAEPDQRRQIAMFAEGVTAQLERVRPMDDILRTAAAVDAEVAALRADLHLRQRRAAMRAVAGWIAAHGPLRDVDPGPAGGDPLERAAAVLWTLAGPEVHQLLRDHCGWSAEEYRDWLRRSLEAELLPADP